ncbi:hypothetical protein EKO04_002754 [Ascochyta lentis]|uniref:Calcineurin-like phosphoesterase domain-containing protein n=1 Tax=Ascochyta lentis TaxID=205686 RepID=A0A8H7MJS5_9PLEO|nr:hypothetical protein EKO04_002754 [Ascochyta lentis]
MSVSKRPRSTTPPTSPPTTKRTRKLTPVRFLILSDTHSTPLPHPLPACDVLLHCGDLTSTGTPHSLTHALQDLGRTTAELKLVIPGNHELALDKAYYLSQGGNPTAVKQAQALVSAAPESEASRNGITFLHEQGTRKFTLASGTSFTLYSSPYTPAFGASAFQYPSVEDRFNPASECLPWATSVGTAASIIPGGVDVVMTHGPAKYVLDGVERGGIAGCVHLRRAVARVRPALFCFGHVHAGYGAQRLSFLTEKSRRDGDAEEDGIVPLPREWVGRNQARRKGFACLPPGSVEAFRRGGQTLAVNAALEGSEEGVLENVPWVVELEL